MTDTNFAGLGLADALLRVLSAEGYERPTPIQAKSIPALLQGRDLLGIAQTGTGKTAAFALPILQRLSEKRERPAMKSARVLVLAPTRELVQQIAESFRTYGRNLGLTQAVVLGGVGMHPQIRALSRGVDILVATPGRLLDLIQQRACVLQTTTTLVLDEADRMLDMGFVRDVQRIVGLMPRQRQSLLFSATMPKDVEELARQMLIEPVRVEVTPPATTVELITQSVHHVDAGAKRDLLTELLADEALRRVIVFTRTKHGADRVAKHLDRAGIRVDAIHGDKTQGARQRALHDFRDGKVRVLVATDIAARGIDVDGISHVINYELPHVPESYVHRIGRTARAGNDGAAIAFCSPEERSLLREIERLTKKPLTVIGQAPAENSRQHGRDPHRQMQHRSRQGQGYAGGGRNSNRPYGKRDDRAQSDGRPGEHRQDRQFSESRPSGEHRQESRSSGEYRQEGRSSGEHRQEGQRGGQGQGGYHRGGASRGKPQQGGFGRPGRSGGQRPNRVA